MPPLASRPPPRLAPAAPLRGLRPPREGPFDGALGLPLRPRLARDELFVGEFFCPGNEPGAETTDHAPHLQIWLQRVGSHTRQTGRSRVVADPTRALLQMPSETYRVSYLSSSPQRSCVLLLAGGLADEVMADGARATGRRLAHAVAISPRASLLDRRLQAALASGQGDGLAAEEIALTFLREVFADASPRPAPAGGGEAWRRRRVVERIEHVLAEQHSTKLTLAAVARYAGVSPFHAAHLFRAQTGTSIHRHLTTIRLRAALARLGDHHHDLACLALAAGFSSHSHFSAAFRRHFGVSPSGMAAALGRRAQRPQGVAQGHR
jgi:AraC family transcriptional regulator